MPEPRFSDNGLQRFTLDCARGRPGAASERHAGGLVWWPTINCGSTSERIPTDDAPFPTQTQAKDAAREFKQRCRDELGETE